MEKAADGKPNTSSGKIKHWHLEAARTRRLEACAIIKVEA
jgi:hypothetical protein